MFTKVIGETMPLLAYKYHDFSEEYSHVGFYESREEARYRASNEIGEDYKSTKVERVPEFDKYAPGPIPERAYIEAGWWFECNNCNQHVDADMDGVVEDDEGNEIQCDGPVYDENERVFCSTKCREAHAAEVAQIRSEKALALKSIGKLFPAATHLRTWNGGKGECGCFMTKPQNIVVDFEIPGAGEHQHNSYCHGCKSFYIPPRHLDLFRSLRQHESFTVVR